MQATNRSRQPPQQETCSKGCTWEAASVVQGALRDSRNPGDRSVACGCATRAVESGSSKHRTAGGLWSSSTEDLVVCDSQFVNSVSAGGTHRSYGSVQSAS